MGARTHSDFLYVNEDQEITCRLKKTFKDIYCEDKGLYSPFYPHTYMRIENPRNAQAQ